MRSNDYNGDCDGQRNANREEKNSKSNSCDKWLYERAIGEGRSRCLAVLTGNTFKTDPCMLKRTAKTESRRGC